jgi:NAD-dependent deacetylase
LLSIGTSSSVWPAAGLADEARSQGAMVVEINPEETPQTRQSDFALREKSGVVLPELLNSLTV